MFLRSSFTVSSCLIHISWLRLTGRPLAGGTIKAGVRDLDCPAIGAVKGGTVNISDAFESYGGSIAIWGSTPIR